MPQVRLMPASVRGRRDLLPSPLPRALETPKLLVGHR